MNVVPRPAREVCILVVDDFAPWRRCIRSILTSQPNLRVIAEVRDGLEAIEKARDLNPSVILMDIRLPNLNGIEAAREILGFAPESKIIFVTQQSNEDVVAAGFAAGGHAYVLKTDAGRELLSAVEMVLQGEFFVSTTLANETNRKAAVPPAQQVCAVV